MSYCKRCGAYIPDEMTQCLACGYDEQAEQEAQAAAAAQAQAEPSINEAVNEFAETIRKQAEERRRQRQENDRIWAENEKRRRQMEEEYQRRQQASGSYTYSAPRTEEQKSARPQSESGGRTMAILSYLGPLSLLTLLAYRDNDFAMYHAKQGLALFILELIGTGFLPVGLFNIYCIIRGISNANDGIRAPLPLLGKLMEKLGIL